MTNTCTMNGEMPPIKQLFGFKRINLNAGEIKQVVLFPLNTESILTIARAGSKWFHPRQYYICIGNQRMFTIELHGHSTLWQRFK